jgi:hypothetical protein
MLVGCACLFFGSRFPITVRVFSFKLGWEKNEHDTLNEQHIGEEHGT